MFFIKKVQLEDQKMKIIKDILVRVDRGGQEPIDMDDLLKNKIKLMWIRLKFKVYR